ncbi:MAG: hypothetical protein IPH31_07275 [Lewinellaceae bacterium]|nr:hypothetical protein [Lewinellaceae bacterium]
MVRHRNPINAFGSVGVVADVNILLDVGPNDFTRAVASCNHCAVPITPAKQQRISVGINRSGFGVRYYGGGDTQTACFLEYDFSRKVVGGG